VLIAVRTIRNVQALRAIAAILVVFVHLDKLLAGIGASTFGAGGVDIFFVISGFIMVYTTMGRQPSPLSFMANRIARIVPIYWAITLVSFHDSVHCTRAFASDESQLERAVDVARFHPIRKVQRAHSTGAFRWLDAKL
jgi:exopolysaccharide production protein ExoZ